MELFLLFAFMCSVVSFMGMCMCNRQEALVPNAMNTTEEGSFYPDPSKQGIPATQAVPI